MATYYWVGGAGTWNTTSNTHWSLTSGGAGGAGIPTSTDNVNFDSNSTGNVHVDGTVYAYDLLINGAVGLTFTSSVGAKIYVYYRARNYIANNSLYICDTTLVLINGSGYSNSYNQYSVYPFKKVEVRGFFTTIYAVGASYNVIDSIDIYAGYCDLSAVVKDLGLHSTTATVSCSDVTVYRNLNVSVASSHKTAGTILLDQDVAISGLSSLSVTVVSGAIVDCQLTVKKGTINFYGSGTILLDVDPAGTAATSLVFSTASNLQFQGLSINGNATRNVVVQSASAGTRAPIRYSGAQITVTYVTVKDIQVVEDDKIISYTANSINSGNNWQWYFDNFNKPIRNLFFGSHA
jgi:hypothetical protein